MITPAPQRQQPRLPPPSTAQIPSKFMPMSSPAQFWKFADIGSTPARSALDMSPLKGGTTVGGNGVDDGDDDGERGGGGDAGSIPSSSPPPPNLASPSKPGTANGLGMGNGRMLPALKTEDVDEKPTGSAPGIRDDEEEEDEEEDEEGEDDGGFDLARCVSSILHCPAFYPFCLSGPQLT
jgi:forkhead protein FKH